MEGDVVRSCAMLPPEGWSLGEGAMIQEDRWKEIPSAARGGTSGDRGDRQTPGAGPQDGAAVFEAAILATLRAGASAGHGPGAVRRVCSGAGSGGAVLGADPVPGAPSYLQPADLLLRELPASVRLLRHPALEPRPHALGVGHQLVVLVQREAHEGHDVGEQPLARRPAHLVLLQQLVGPPQDLRRPRARRGLDRRGQGLDVVVAQPVAVRHREEELERVDLVLVVGR